MYSQIEKLASAIKNNVDSGLRGFHTNLSLSDELIADTVVLERLQILKEYSLKGILPLKDLYLSINCIEIDCKDMDRCMCNKSTGCPDDPVAHFEIPQLLNDYGNQAISYIGSTDRRLPFLYYTTSVAFRNQKYRKRGKNKPYVWIDTTPNANGMYDCFVFNAPLLKQISVVAIFKDPRQLEAYSCCTDLPDNNMNFIDNEIVKRCTEKFLRYYRQFATPLVQNDQTYQPG